MDTFYTPLRVCILTVFYQNCTLSGLGKWGGGGGGVQRSYMDCSGNKMPLYLLTCFSTFLIICNSVTHLLRFICRGKVMLPFILSYHYLLDSLTDFITMSLICWTGIEMTMNCDQRFSSRVFYLVSSKQFCFAVFTFLYQHLSKWVTLSYEICLYCQASLDTFFLHIVHVNSSFQSQYQCPNIYAVALCCTCIFFIPTEIPIYGQWNAR